MTTLGARTSLRTNRVCLALVFAATLGLAIFHYAQFRSDPRPLWNGIVHDRSGHYQFAQELAIAVRSANPVAFFATLEKAKVWPPLHGLCAAVVLAVGGIDYRLAVLPSLVGWIATAVFGFLLARRCSASSGNVAGVIAVAMILASPAVRAYALDIMLESLGAALTLAALYYYSVARETPTLRTWRWFALTLTFLFFEKYNYWLLVVLALSAAELLHLTARTSARVWHFFTAIDWKRALRREVRQPLTWLFVVIALTALAIFIIQPGPLSLGGKRVSLYPPNNLVTVAYAALFFRLLRIGKPWHIGQPVLRQLLTWHCLPLAVSFLLPRRLSTFIWFLGPLNRGEQSPAPIGEVVRSFLDALVNDYHPAEWAAAAAVVFFVWALCTFRRMRPAGRALILLVLISAALTLTHPNHKSRFLHSWLPALWIVGAAGLVNSLALAGRAGRPLAVTAAIAIAASLGGDMFQPGRAPELGKRGEISSLLEITDTYLPEIGDRRVAIFSTVPCRQLLLWTYHERYPRLDKIEIPIKDYPLSPDEMRVRQAAWEATNQAEVVVFIDIAPASSDYLPIAGDYAAFHQIGQSISSNPQFSRSREWSLPNHACTILIWTRN